MDHDQPPSSENTLPSGPQPAVFSDEASRPLSPPSSPPGFPWDYDNATKTTPQCPQKSAFSLLGKRKTLSPVSDNARPAKKPALAKKKTEHGALTQMQISLGQEVQKRCKTCGMEYILSSAEDRKLHDKYHRQNTEGYDVGKDFVRHARNGTVLEGGKKGDVICTVDYHDNSGRKTKVQAVLDIVQRELGAVEIDEDDIWDAKNHRAMRHRSYLYLRGTKCIGFLLLESISVARNVVAPDLAATSTSEEDRPKTRSNNATSALKRRREAVAEDLERAASSPIESSKESVEATMGVSRIWTSSRHRRQNVATKLLDAAVKHHMQTAQQDVDFSQHDNDLHQQKMSQDTAIEKEKVAFSQPTESGARLARRWFGKAYGWKVYVD